MHEYRPIVTLLHICTLFSALRGISFHCIVWLFEATEAGDSLSSGGQSHIHGHTHGHIHGALFDKTRVHRWTTSKKYHTDDRD